MPTYTLEFLSRDDDGRFTERHQKIPATDHREAFSYAIHGERHGKWAIESDITAHKLGGDSKTHPEPA